ncbi:type II toxin-antitoxin system RelE/ParE family toxin [bacterium AH-315-M05]|nr:type II toxin-antitoxin system RelE/ParE family toxin [bacterium AH-315-M05]
MIVKIDRSFEKDTSKIKDKTLLRKIAYCIEFAAKASDLRSIKNLKKMKGSPGHFRIRIGEYRIGMVITSKTIIFERFLHRKDIYSYFP